MPGDINFHLFSERDTKGSKSGFLDAVTVWINKPHVVNRRLSGSRILCIRYVDKETFHDQNQQSVSSFISCSLMEQPTNRLAKGDNNLKLDRAYLARLIYLARFALVPNLTNTDNINDGHIGNDSDNFLEVESLNDIPVGEMAIIKRKIISKEAESSITETIIVDGNRDNTTVTFNPACPGDSGKEAQPYQLIFITDPEGLSRIQLMSTGNKETSGIFDWMTNTLLPKLCNWSSEKSLKTSVTSLRLVPIEDYCQKYSYLKQKYGKHFVENWPESTDPQKFVYEDIAIAAYLLVLWKKERERKKLECLQTFVDLGCGNGLLVHFLSSEGHPGVGLDIRKRRIWDMYGDKTALKEVTVTPSSENTFPEYDWLIGNHSDELTPWIPVIAARSSYNCRYFVLPCCHYDFDCKFSSKQPGLSNYRTYLNFVKEVGEVCGFNVEEDTLRIPSTKRVCFVGQDRNYSEDEEPLIDDKRTVYIQTRSKNNSKTEHSAKYQKLDNGQKWSKDFEPREQSKEKSRNCQHVDKDVKNLIINTVFERVLDQNPGETRQLPDGRIWRKGGCIPLGDVVKLFEKETLKQLKSECGGLQTLLKNHNNIFNVSGGNVQLRDLSLQDPYSKKSQLSKKDKSQYFKTLPCWFYSNHPDGCPRTGVTCTFAHGDQDIKPRICDKQTNFGKDLLNLDNRVNK